MKKILVVLVLLFIISCASYQPSTEYNFVKVLGITAEGDTIPVSINLLRPRVHNNYYYSTGINRYPYNYNYYNSPPIIIRPPSTPRPNRPTINNKPRPTINISKPNTSTILFNKPTKGRN